MSPREQEDWLAYDRYCQRRVSEVTRALADKGLLTPEAYAMLAVSD